MGATNGLALPFPELTEAADGPDAISDLANAVEDYVYDRILPAGVTRAPAYYWGSGTAFPTSPLLRIGDTFSLTATISYATWYYVGGGFWRTIGETIVADVAARNVMWAAIPAAGKYSGFRVWVASMNQFHEWDAVANLWRGSQSLALGASSVAAARTNVTVTGFQDVATFPIPDPGFPYYLRPVFQQEVNHQGGSAMALRLMTDTDTTLVETYTDTDPAIWKFGKLIGSSATLTGARTAKLQVGQIGTGTWSASTYLRYINIELFPVRATAGAWNNP